jgi:hypothetical protein
MLSLKLPNLSYHGINVRKLSREQKLRIAKHYRENPLAWWAPSGGQFDFLKDLDQIGKGRPGHRCRVGFMSGGNCTGKSCCETHTVNGLLQPKIYNPFLKKCKFFTDRSWAHGFGPNGTISICAIMKKKVIQKVFVPEMKKWAPAGSYTTEKGDDKFEHIWRFKDGGVLNLFTTEQNIGQIEGGSYDVILTDEHFPFHFWDELDARLRGRGTWLIFQTPKYAKDSAQLVGKIMDLPKDERVVRFLHKETACKTHGVRGWREHADIQEEINRCATPEQYATRVEGKPMAYIGKVFKNFSHVHNVKSEEWCIKQIKKHGATLYGACDPAEARLNAFAWAAVLPNNDIIWIDEWPNWDPGLSKEPQLGNNPLLFYLSPRLSHHKDIKERMGPELFCDIILAKEATIKKKYGLDINVRFVDRTYTSRTPTGSQMTLRAQYAQCGVPMLAAEAEKELVSGHNRIRDLISLQLDGDDRILSPPKMYFCEDNRNQIHAIANICYDVETKQGEYTGRLEEKIDPRDPLKDFIDVTRYLLQKNPYYVEPIKDIKPTIQLDHLGNRKTPMENYGKYAGL